MHTAWRTVGRLEKSLPFAFDPGLAGSSATLCVGRCKAAYPPHVS